MKSNKISSSEKYFIVYLDDYYKIKPLSVILPKMSAYVKSYDDGTKWMYFLIEDLRYLQAFLKECEVIEKEENVD